MPAFNLECAEDTSDATGPIIEDITEFCDFCVALMEFILENSKPGTKALRTILSSPPETSSESCRFCEMISSIRGGTRTELVESHKKGWYSGYVTCDDREEKRRGRPCEFDLGDVVFAVWADTGSAASRPFFDRPPILDPSVSAVCDLVRAWRKECNTHKECLPEAQMAMPTRVLTLCGDDTQPSIRLLESNGLKGQYIALSHCWGSTKNRPMQTTSKSFAAHHENIAFIDLPKTFQDVVRFAQAIGITYIWIDSLCIIQDDHQDWMSEAGKMGSVYRNAALVVAASGAKDSSRGLFTTDRPRARVFRLPFIEDDQINGTFNFMPLSHSDRDPGVGPLEKRAWTLQERWLARQFISFMPQGITWICKHREVNDTGRSYKLASPFYRYGGPEYDWDNLLREYTMRSLTIPSDRIEAIKGIAEEIQRSRDDQYLSHCGVWTGGPLSQLFWLRDSPCPSVEKSSNVGSWSWAATESAKRWPEIRYPTGYNHLKESETAPDGMAPKILAFTGRGHLLVTGHLSTSQQARSYVRDEEAARKLTLDKLQKQYYWWSEEVEDFHILTQEKDGPHQQTVLGMARFDLDGVSSYTHVGIFAKQNHWGKDDPEDYPEVGTPESRLKEHIINGVIYHIDWAPFCIYWALLLEQVDGNRFRRVGMALLLPIAYEAFQVQIQEYEVM